MHVCCHTRVECRSLFDTADYWLRHDVVKWTRFVETTSVWWCHGCVAQPLEPLFTPWVLLEGGRNTKSLKWATYLTYLCFTMTIRGIKIETCTPRAAKHLWESKSYYIGGRLATDKYSDAEVRSKTDNTILAPVIYLLQPRFKNARKWVLFTIKGNLVYNSCNL